MTHASTCNTLPHAAPSYRDSATANAALLKLALSWLSHGYATYRQRRHLAALDAAALSDVGLTRAQAQNEASRPLWDLPHPSRTNR